MKEHGLADHFIALRQCKEMTNEVQMTKEAQMTKDQAPMSNNDQGRRTNAERGEQCPRPLQKAKGCVQATARTHPNGWC